MYIVGVKCYVFFSATTCICGYCVNDVYMMHNYVTPQDSLPPCVYIQMDNTCRDNKNKYILTFASLLVQLGIFRKARAHTLHV